MTSWNQHTGTKTRTLAITGLTANVSYSTASPAIGSVSVTVDQYRARTTNAAGYSLRGVTFALGDDRFVQLTDNTLVKATDIGVPVGTVSAGAGVVYLDNWTTGASSLPTNWRGLLAPSTEGTAAPFTAFQSVFRTASAPLRPGSFSVLGTMQDGTTFNVTAGTDGKINGTRVKGKVDYEFGLVQLYFVNPSGSANLNIDLSGLQIGGLTTIPADLARLNSLRYNAVAYSYLPLDADLLGIDPVRLPTDGRVPVFRKGGFAVVGHTGEITATVSNAQVIDCARVRLSRVRVIGNDGAVINTGYTTDLDAGTVTFTNVTGYSQPVTVEHRVEDMAIVRELQINGEISFTRALTHNYPLGSFVSSALVAGDMYSHVSVFFDQGTWDTITWVDAVLGSPAAGTYNQALSPVEVTNKGAVTERWALRFTSSTAFQIIGEKVGVIGTGDVNVVISPNNPATGVPYFTLNPLGWGAGWAVGNVVRFNTVGALFPVWVVRTIQQGPETVTDDSFTLLIRGDVDRP